MGSYAEATAELIRIRTAVPGVKVRRDPNTVTTLASANSDNLLLVQDTRPSAQRLADASLATAGELVQPGKHGWVHMESEAGESVYKSSASIA